MMEIQFGKILTGDNLEIMREFESESFDLVYLDPPYCSNKNYKGYSGSKAESMSFDDMWLSKDPDENERQILNSNFPDLLAMINAVNSIHGKPMGNYLFFMAVRLIEMHRLLNDTGSIFMQVDPTASHYLKLIMDGIFNKDNFRNEIVWCYGKWTNAARHFQRNHDVILYYGKTDRVKFNPQHEISDNQRKIIARGWHTNVIKGKTQLLVYDREKAATKIEQGKYDRIVFRDDSPGTLMKDWWNDISYVNSQANERNGYPTQKPEKLLERIILSATDYGDAVLDPFCGSGTTLAAADGLSRKWLGIDESIDAVELATERLVSEPVKSGLLQPK